MFGYSSEDSPMNDFWGVIGASALKYLADSLQKKEAGKVWPQALEGVVGIGMLVGRHSVSHPTAKAIAEASGYTLTSSAIGTFAASNTVTLGNIAKGNIPTMKNPTSASAFRNRGIGPVRVSPPVIPMQGGWNPWNELGYPS